MAKYLDGWLHAVGVCTLGAPIVNRADSSELRVSLLFQGGEVVVSVPKKYLIDQMGVPMFNEDDSVFVDIRLGVESNVKSFQGNSYSKLNITVRKVNEFRKLTAEESKAL